MSHTFEVSYIGWSPAKGLWGEDTVQPVFQRIIDCRQSQVDFVPDTLQIRVRHQHLSILKEIPSRLSVRTFVDCPNIPVIDISYATMIIYRGQVYVCLLVLGYDPDTGEPVHLYVYQMKNNEEASRLVDQIRRRTLSKEIRQRIVSIEKMLVEDGKVAKSRLSTRNSFKEEILNVNLNSSNTSSNRSSMSERLTQSTRQYTTTMDQIMPSNGVISELNHKLNGNEKILLPPRDYDTVHRRHGNCNIITRSNEVPLNHLPFSDM